MSVADVYNNNDNVIDDNEDDITLVNIAHGNINTNAIKNNMENDIFFADPYYDLSPHKIVTSTHTKSSHLDSNSIKCDEK